LNENIFTIKSHSFLSNGVSPCIELKAKDRNSLHKIFSHILDLFNFIPKQNWELVARSLTSGLIYGIDNILDKYIDYSKLKLNEPEKTLAQFKSLVFENFIEKSQVSYYASKLNISRSYLYSIVKKYTGESPSTFINRQLISEAKRQLSSSPKNISEIAYSLNFSDPYIFSKFFKSYTGYSPTQFRTKL